MIAVGLEVTAYLSERDSLPSSSGPVLCKYILLTVLTIANTLPYHVVGRHLLLLLTTHFSCGNSFATNRICCGSNPVCYLSGTSRIFHTRISLVCLTRLLEYASQQSHHAPPPRSRPRYPRNLQHPRASRGYVRLHYTGPGTASPCVQWDLVHAHDNATLYLRSFATHHNYNNLHRDKHHEYLRARVPRGDIQCSRGSVEGTPEGTAIAAQDSSASTFIHGTLWAFSFGAVACFLVTGRLEALALLVLLVGGWTQIGDLARAGEWEHRAVDSRTTTTTTVVVVTEVVEVTMPTSSETYDISTGGLGSPMTSPADFSSATVPSSITAETTRLAESAGAGASNSTRLYASRATGLAGLHVSASSISPNTTAGTWHSRESAL